MRVVLVCLLLATLGGAARADDADDVKRLSADARALAQEGKLTEAIALYRKAYDLSENPVFLCNIGLAYQLAGDLPRAHAQLTQCMPRLAAAMPEAVANFQQALDAVEKALPEKHVAVDVRSQPAGAMLDVDVLHGDVQPSAPAVVWLPAGAHAISASLAGRETASETVTITADDIAAHPKKSVTIRLPEARRDELPPPPPPIESASTKRRNGWIAIGVGGALLAGGGVAHAIAYDTRSELAGTSGDAYHALYPKFRNQRAAAFALYGLGAAAAITGAVLIMTAPRPIAEHVTVAPTDDAAGAMVWLAL
jgi:tetratricopeptide (TPR) repeat protein